jgi:hypothetical protein
MGEVVKMPDRRMQANPRMEEAKLLADVIEKKQARFAAGECERVADRVYRIFDDIVAGHVRQAGGDSRAS